MLARATFMGTCLTLAATAAQHQFSPVFENDPILIMKPRL